MGNSMSFSVTRSELIRVIAAYSHGLSLDPRQAADLIMDILISLLYFFQFIGVVFMLWNREYPPIKAKNPVLMTCVFVSSLMWFIGDIQANGHAPLKGTPMENCKAFGVWVRVLLGVCGMSALLGLRSYGLYRVFCRKMAYRGLAFYIPFIVTSACMLGYGIVLQALPKELTIEYMDGVDICYYNTKYKASLYALLWGTWVIIAGLNWCIRGIKSSFNETREILITCFIVFGVLGFMTAMSYTNARYPLNLKLRILATSLDQCAASAVWWLMMAVPLYQCLTNRQRYLKEWIYTLREDGLQQAYHMETGETACGNTSGGNLSYLNPRKPTGNHPLTTLVSNGGHGTEFYYDGKDQEKIAFPKIGSEALNSRPFNQSDSSLVQNPMAPILGSDANPPVKRPWEKLTVGFGAPSFTSNPVPPIPSPAAAYKPILEPTSTTMLRLDDARDSSVIEDGQYGHPNRQLI
ncbi:hypothetical protein H4218_005376 [Coemansia sp. IMI 209128]|nr:hypothetical protein H4218_005376 [Coemansia sp. IMI 209128]